MSLKSIRKFGGWIGKQVDGFIGGVMRLAGTSPGAWLPAGIWSTVLWLARATTWSVGTSTPIRQITSSFALALFALLTSWVTLGATLALVAFFAMTMVFGVLRLFPVVDRYFVSVRETVIPRA
jgi:hypothetical protein